MSKSTKLACRFLVACAALNSFSPGVAQPEAPTPERALSHSLRGKEVRKGYVSQYLLNPHGEVDGLFLADGGQIHLPPHLSSALVANVKINDFVTANGVAENSHVFRAWRVVANKGSIAVVDNGPPGPPLPPAIPHLPNELHKLQAQARVKAYLYSPRGDINGFLLSERTIVRMPPETAFNISHIFKIGDVMAVEGLGSENSQGRCIEAVNIGIEGQPMIPIYDTARTKRP